MDEYLDFSSRNIFVNRTLPNTAAIYHSSKTSPQENFISFQIYICCIHFSRYHQSPARYCSVLPIKNHHKLYWSDHQLVLFKFSHTTHHQLPIPTNNHGLLQRTNKVTCFLEYTLAKSNKTAQITISYLRNTIYQHRTLFTDVHHMIPLLTFSIFHTPLAVRINDLAFFLMLPPPTTNFLFPTLFTTKQ